MWWQQRIGPGTPGWHCNRLCCLHSSWAYWVLSLLGDAEQLLIFNLPFYVISPPCSISATSLTPSSPFKDSHDYIAYLHPNNSRRVVSLKVNWLITLILSANEALCTWGKTCRTGLQIARYFQEPILWAQFLYLLISTKALNPSWWPLFRVTSKSFMRLAGTFWKNMCLTAHIPPSWKS